MQVAAVSALLSLLVSERSVPPERSASASASAARIWLAAGAPGGVPGSGHGIYAREPSSPAETGGPEQGKPCRKIGGPPAEDEPSIMPGPPPVSVQECAYCFSVLERRLADAHGSVDEYEGPHAAEACGIFVTWKRNDALLGCIGTLSAVEPYGAHLAHYALAAAFEDRRFPPISELTRDTSVTVSRLGAWERVPDPLTGWTIGEHGLILRVFAAGSGETLHSGTFLPEVAEEHGWSVERTLDQLVSKAGVPPRSHAAVYALLCGGSSPTEAKFRVELTRYSTVRRTLYYDEYLSL